LDDPKETCFCTCGSPPWRPPSVEEVPLEEKTKRCCRTPESFHVPFRKLRGCLNCTFPAPIHTNPASIPFFHWTDRRLGSSLQLTSRYSPPSNPLAQWPRHPEKKFDRRWPCRKCVFFRLAEVSPEDHRRVFYAEPVFAFSPPRDLGFSFPEEASFKRTPSLRGDGVKACRAPVPPWSIRLEKKELVLTDTARNDSFLSFFFFFSFLVAVPSW